MSIITLDQLRNAATESKDYSDEIGAALYTLANTANTVAASAYTLAATANTTAASAYALANNASGSGDIVGTYSSTDESLTFSIG